MTIRFPCQAVAFLAGLLTPVIGSALLGIGALVGIELAKELVDPNVPTPQQQPSPVPTIGGVRWSSLAIAQEGLLLQGDIDAERFSDAPTLQGLCDFNFERYESFNRLAPKGIAYDAAFAGFLRGAYVRHENWSHPHVSPIHADLRGFPPTMLVVGSADPIVDSARSFANKLEEAGNEHVEFFVSEGMPHGFYFFPRLFREEEVAYDAVEKFLQKHLAVGE